MTDRKILTLNPSSPSTRDHDDADALGEEIADLEQAGQRPSAHGDAEIIHILMDAIPIPDNVIPLQRRGRK
ncbi:MAG: hypothetical protein QOF00_4069 [Pseudonocardiales bacterium]|jgi:hypothetical protein|nr:hypothetical protein [Pseudonocardiales bacterium]